MDRTWLLFTKAVSSRDSRVRLEIDRENRRGSHLAVIRDDEAEAIPQSIEVENESSCSCHAHCVLS